MEILVEKFINICLVIFLVTVVFGTPQQLTVVTIGYIAVLAGGAVYYYRKHPEKLRWHKG